MTPMFLARPLTGALLASLAGATLAASQIHVAPYLAPPPAPASAPITVPVSPEPAPAADEARVVQPVMAETPVAASAAPAANTAAPKPTPALAPFSVRAGDDLTLALAAWCKAAGWHFDWQAQSATPGRLRHFIAEADWATQPASVQDLLRRALVGLGVRAQVLDAAKRIVVRNDNNLSE